MTPVTEKGTQTREAILDRAVDLATVEGLEGLTIGHLAAELRMSKSGLFAHFGSKQELQLATIGAASERFKGRVIDPALDLPDGAPRLRAMAERYLDQLGDYSGGCFWAATSTEYDDRPGPVRDAIAGTLDAWLAELERQARVAGVENPARFAFELYALVMGTNSRYRLSGDERIFGYAREAIGRLLMELPGATRVARVAVPQNPRRKELQMDVAIGLPNAVPGTTGKQLTDWARRAEELGFSSLGTIDRIAYPNLEPLASLAAAAAVTERIGLATTVLLGPLRPNPVALAKQVQSVHQISGGRMTLGIGLGGREDDYEAVGVSMKTRGKVLDEMLERMREVWGGEQVGPQTETEPRVLVGGGVEASFKRAARFGDGWIASGAPSEAFAGWREEFEAAWSAAGREEPAQNAGLAYFSLGDSAEEDAKHYLTDYYAWLGEETANWIADSAAKTPEAVQQYLSAFEQAGCQELFLFPSSSEPRQVDLLAEAAGL